MQLETLGSKKKKKKKPHQQAVLGLLAQNSEPDWCTTQPRIFATIIPEMIIEKT